MIPAKKMVRRWLTVVLLLLGGIIVLNALVDPFDALRIVYQPGFNTVKPKMKSYVRFSKPMQVQWRKPHSLVMGSSRSEFGYPMTHPGWADASAFNYAMSGSNIYNVYRFFQHAVRQAPIEHVLIGVDFFMFNSYNLHGFAEEAIVSVRENGQKNPTYRRQQLFQLLLSVDAFNATTETLRKQDKKHQRYTPGGRITPSTRKRRTAAVIRDKFTATELSYALNAWTPCANNAFAFAHADGTKNTLDYLARILALAKQHHIRVSLVISPSHARLWELLDYAGFWPKFEDWKRRLLATVRAAEMPHVALWDFSGYNAYTVEQLPEQGAMQWYLDTSHYRAELGWKILDRIFQHTNADPAFGQRLTEQNIDRHLLRLRVAQTQYRQSLNAAQQQSLQQLARKYKARRETAGSACF